MEDEYGNPVTVYDVTTNINRPHLLKTTRLFVEELGAKNGSSYELIGEYDSFIGVLKLYECQ
jgi:hypothetical protein